MPEPGGASLPKKPHLDPKFDSCQGGRRSVGSVSTSTTDSWKKGSHGKTSFLMSYSKDHEEAQLQDTTVLICSYVITLAYSTPGGDL